MSDLVRFGVSIDERLLQRFDALVAEMSYVNRSEALRDLIRNALVEDQWKAGDTEAIGTVTLVYDHRAHDLADKLTDHQHSHHEEIVSTLHVHLDARYCLEVIVLRGAFATAVGEENEPCRDPGKLGGRPRCHRRPVRLAA